MERKYFVCCIHRTPLAKCNIPISLADLEQYDAVLLTNESIMRQRFNLLLKQKHISMKTLAEVNTIYTNIQIVESGSSWCLIYEQLLNEKLTLVKLSDFSMDI